MNIRLFRNRKVSLTDKRTPMKRLLEDGYCEKIGDVCEIQYEQQWKTVRKAIKRGLLDDYHRLTEKGYLFLNQKDTK